jgi:hypothetical protein
VNPSLKPAELMMARLDSIVPNTPRVASASRPNGTSKRRNFETPGISRVKAEPGSSPLTSKTSNKLGETGSLAQYAIFRFLPS